MTAVMLGINLGMTVCSVADFYGGDCVVVSKRPKQNGFVPVVATLTPCPVAMDACFGAHYLGPRLIELDYEVRPIALQYVRP